MKMKALRIFGLFVITAGLFTACSTNEENDTTNDGEQHELGLDTAAFLQELSDLENRIESAIDIPKEQDLKEAITKFQDFANIFPEDPKAADYLLRASDICLTTEQPEKSVKLLNQIIDKYPEYDRMEDVKYNRASHLDFELRDTTAAKEAYQEFIAEYPNSVLVNDCQSRIENIKYSMEELTEKFMKELEESSSNYP